jgi:predicted nuclease of predicted toxin-antitoxin system
MAIKNTVGVVWSRFHLLIRLLGLTGLAAALAGLTITLIFDLLHLDSIADLHGTWAIVERALQTGSAGRVANWGIVLLVLGSAVALIALALEILVIGRHAAGRRSAMGINVLAQIAIAAAMLLGINLWSYHHPARFDWTRNQQFTFPPEIQERLNKLQGDTTIVVYLPHQSFGQRAGTLDPETRAYVSAAEHKVVEKLKDMVEQFRQYGKQFEVVVLDVEDWKNFKRKLDETTAKLPELKTAINDAPENTVFFAAQGNVQRLSFNELFLLDREASVNFGKEPNKPDSVAKGNLVLLDQGLDPLVHKIEAIGEKRPRVGIAVVHGWLSSKGRADFPFTMAGVRKTLVARGFEVKDVVLKKWGQFPLVPAVDTPEDTIFDQITDRLTRVDNSVRRLDTLLENQTKVLTIWQKEDLPTLTKMYGEDLGLQKITQAERERWIKRIEDGAVAIREDIARLAERRKDLLADKSKLNVDSLAESRRMADLQAKLTNTLADCDMLIIPRMTLRNLLDPTDNIPVWMQRLDDAQVDVIRDFIKQGKPVLFCLGPTNDSGERTPPGSATGPDGIEQMLTRLGVKLPVQTVLFDSEAEEFTGRGGSDIFGGEANVELPPVKFDWKPAEAWPRGANAGQLHPIRKNMQLIARSLGKDPQDKSMLDDLKLRYCQPVYYEPAGAKLTYDPTVMMTAKSSWNEDKPFPTEKSIPEPPKTAPTKGTIEEKRRGPFPIAAAFTTKLPADWYTDKNAKPADVRMVVIGSGGIFNGAELSPAREMLLLDSCNWLLGRDQELALRDEAWTYPRVELSPRAQELWRWFAWVGLPGLFAYLGLVVLLVRRVR